MWIKGFQHFLFVGVVGALCVGWLLTFVVNTLLGYSLALLIGRPPTDFYLGALMLTFSSLSLILAAAYVGNRLYFSRVAVPEFNRQAVIVSSLLFLGLVTIIFGPELLHLMRRILFNLSDSYRHSSEVAMHLSLVCLRLIVLPLGYWGLLRSMPTPPLDLTRSSTEPPPSPGFPT